MTTTRRGKREMKWVWVGGLRTRELSVYHSLSAYNKALRNPITPVHGIKISHSPSKEKRNSLRCPQNRPRRNMRDFSRDSGKSSYRVVDVWSIHKLGGKTTLGTIMETQEKALKG